MNLHHRPRQGAKEPTPRQASQLRDQDAAQVPCRPCVLLHTTGLVCCSAELTFFFFSRRLLWQTEKVLRVPT